MRDAPTRRGPRFCRALLAVAFALLGPLAAGAQPSGDPDPAAPATTPAPAPAATPAPAGSTEPLSGGAAATSPPDREHADVGEALGARQSLRLRELQNRVVSLKEEIYRTKTRLMLIKERLLNNVIAESKLVLVHLNELGGSFAIEEVVYYLDDNKIYFGEAASSNVDEAKEFTVFDGNVVPGHHALAVEIVIKGDASVFTYVQDFRFRIRSTYTFFAPRGRISALRVVAYEKGGMLTDFRDRPNVKYELQQYPYTRENLQKVSGGKSD